MLILTIKTDNPVAEIGLFEDVRQLGYEKWQADRQLSSTIHTKIHELLKKSDKDWQDIEGVVFFKGPGSFTGLRIGASVVNAIISGVSALAVSATDENWKTDGIKLLIAGKSEITIVPDYGAEPHITKPVK